MSDHKKPAAPVIEILDLGARSDICVPTDVRINGESLLCADEPVVIDRMDLIERGLVKVTITFIAKRVVIGHADD